jgi:hypothetical protein
MIFTAALGVLGLAGAILGNAEPRGQPRAAVQQTPTGIRLPSEGEMPSLDSAARWLNSRPLTAAELRGKVVLIEFWTYSCINAWNQLDFFYKKGLGYANEMANRPQTLYGLVDSPVGLAAWMLDHDARSQEMIARVFAGKTEGLTRDDILDNITLYWFTRNSCQARA